PRPARSADREAPPQGGPASRAPAEEGAAALSSEPLVAEVATRAPERPALAAEPLLAGLDALAAAVLALGGAAIATALDPLSWAPATGAAVPRAWLEALLGHGGWLGATIAAVFALLGPL